MNKIVREHYPAARLPDDLRGEFRLEAEVTVTIEESSRSRPRISSGGGSDTRDPRQEARAALIADLLDHRKLLQPSAPDAVERVRALRDEWDTR